MSLETMVDRASTAASRTLRVHTMIKCRRAALTKTRCEPDALSSGYGRCKATSQLVDRSRSEDRVTQSPLGLGATCPSILYLWGRAVRRCWGDGPSEDGGADYEPSVPWSTRSNGPRGMTYVTSLCGSRCELVPIGYYYEPGHHFDGAGHQDTLSFRPSTRGCRDLVLPRPSMYV